MWKIVTPTPPGYLEVVRRTFSNGLQVLLLIRQKESLFEVLSAVDHNTLVPTEKVEGTAQSLPAAVALLHASCNKWDEHFVAPAAAGQTLERLFFYLESDGQPGGPVTRDKIFELLESGTITWSAFIAEKPRSAFASGQYESIMRGLGFPGIVAIKDFHSRLF